MVDASADRRTLRGLMNWDPETYSLHTPYVSELGRPVLDLLRPEAGERVLDLGCGDGALTIELVRRGCRVTGVDTNMEMAEAGRKLGLQVDIEDGHMLPYEKEFDAVFSNAALHWMLQPDQVISGVYRALKNPGRFVGEMGGEGNIALLHQALRAQIAEWGIDPDKIDPWYFPSVRDYRRRLERAGFGVEQIELIERPTPLPTGIDGWIQSVAHPFLAALSHSDRQKFVSEVEEQVRPSLYDESGTWYADYVRLRFSAFKISL